jgi:nitric oxide reductase subunit C
VAEGYLQSGEYSGETKTVEEFIYESVVDPDAFIPMECPGGLCQEGLMPTTLGELLSEQELEAVVSFLASLPSEAAETAD